MTKTIEPPKSWRDLTHAELVALLEDQLLLIRPSDLVWAQWKVASADYLAAGEAESRAFNAEWEAHRVWREKGNSKTLAAHEAAQAKHKRAAAAMERLKRKEDALYALHQQLCEAERS